MPLPHNETTLLLDDFESGNMQKWDSFLSNNSNITANVTSPGQFGTHAMKVDYSIGEGGWGGVERIFVVPQNWSTYQTIQFSFYGTNSSSTIRFEILENHGIGSNVDSSERFEYKFNDNFNGWKTFNLPWNIFVRRSDWQPEGAPNDGFSRTIIWGFNFAPVNGQGSFQVDDIKLVSP